MTLSATKLTPVSDTRRYCEDCRHCRPANYTDERTALQHARCDISAPAPMLARVSRLFDKPNFCEVARMTGQPCGSEGKLFEPKTENAQLVIAGAVETAE